VIPKAPVQAQILIGLFAVLAIAYGASIMRLENTSTETRHAIPGQLILVRSKIALYYATSSDPWVVAPIRSSTSAARQAYFIALKPGHATLRAFYSACTQCRLASWQLEVIVWPSG
jgi:hypothetical protein